MTKEEAIKKIKEWDFLNDGEKEVLETLIPELAESEEEKIKNWIIDDIRYNMNNEPLNNSEYKKKAEKAIAWLEKQNTVKFNDEKDEMIRKALIDGFTVMKESKNCGKTFSNHNIPVVDILAWLEKQASKTKWTEEDEKRLQSCISSLQGKGLMGGVDTINTKWLKSLKQRQVESKWIEEDSKMLGTLIAIFEVNCPDGFYKVNPIGTTDMQGIHSSEIVKWLRTIKQRMEEQK